MPDWVPNANKEDLRRKGARLGSWEVGPQSCVT